MPAHASRRSAVAPSTPARLIRLALLGILLAALSPGIGWTLDAAQETAPEAPPQAADTKILVWINGEPITEAQVLRRLRSVDPRVDVHRDDPNRWSRLIESATEAEVRDRLLLQSARSDGLRVSREELATALERTRALLGEARYEQMLTEQHADEDRFAAFLADRLLIDKYQSKITADIAIDDATLHAYYRGHKASFRSPALVHLEIVDLADTESVQRVAEQLRHGAALAALSEIDTSIRTKDLWIDLRRLPPALAEQIEAAEPNDVLDPIAAGKTTRVIRVGERKPSRQLSYEEAEPLIRERLMTSRRQAALDAWYERARRTAELEYR